jgi:hypothetical protein
MILMSIKELKALAAKYGTNITSCFEKSDIIAVLNKRETRKKLANESLARFALRIAYLDRLRNCILEEELCSFNWNIRCRSDGPLVDMIQQDPWWSSEGIPSTPTTTIVNFSKDGNFKFSFNGPVTGARCLS